jgi:hypothetical protein
MFRRIKNFLEGRRKTTDDSLTFKEALDLLKGLPNYTRGNIEYRVPALDIYRAYWNIDPYNMAEFFNLEFSLEGQNASRKLHHKIRHQVYARGEDERHYLDIKLTNFYERKTLKSATIEFELKKKV